MALSIQARLPQDYTSFVPNLRALVKNPLGMAEGAMWGGWCGLGSYYAGASTVKLFRVCSAEHPLNKKFEKIVKALKAVFVDSLSLGSSACYLARWAEGAKVISLGAYLPLVENLCYGTSLVMNGTEAAADIYHIWAEKEAICREPSLFEQERHKQRLCHSLMRLVAHVSMVAWAALGMAALAGVAVSAALSLFLLGTGCIVGVAAILYKMQIPKSTPQNA